MVRWPASTAQCAGLSSDLMAATTISIEPPELVGVTLVGGVPRASSPQSLFRLVDKWATEQQRTASGRSWGAVLFLPGGWDVPRQANMDHFQPLWSMQGRPPGRPARRRVRSPRARAARGRPLRLGTWRATTRGRLPRAPEFASPTKSRARLSRGLSKRPMSDQLLGGDGREHGARQQPRGSA